MVFSRLSLMFAGLWGEIGFWLKPGAGIAPVMAVEALIDSFGVAT